MNKNPITPKIAELRRTQRIIKRQIQSRTAELEKVNESLRDEITKLKRIEKELNVRLQERTAELTRVNEALLKEAAERARAAETLRESAAQQSQTSKFNQAVMANMGEGLYTLDTRGLATYINPAAERLFGWSSAELLGRKMHDVIHYDIPTAVLSPPTSAPGYKSCRRGRSYRITRTYLFEMTEPSFPSSIALRPSRRMARSSGWLWSSGT